MSRSQNDWRNKGQKKPPVGMCVQVVVNSFYERLKVTAGIYLKDGSWLIFNDDHLVDKGEEATYFSSGRYVVFWKYLSLPPKIAMDDYDVLDMTNNRQSLKSTKRCKESR